MLESIRNASQGVIGKAVMTVVMGLIIVSFVIWGVGDMLRGFTSSTVASVGGAKITEQDYRSEFQRTLQQYQRQLRQPFTNEQARAIGLDRQVLQKMVSEAALDEETRRLGLGISQDALRKLITANPEFQDKSGAFDAQRFAELLRNNDMNEQMYVGELRKSAVRQLLFAALTTGLTAPKAETKAEADYEGQTRSADTFVLPEAAAGDIPAASKEALEAFYKDRKASYRAPEFRSADVVALEPQTIANPNEVSDADARAGYARVAGKNPKYGSPEKRDLQQIMFPNQAEAEGAEAKIKAGATFDDIVSERKLQPKDTDLGETTKDRMIDKAEAEAVFALPQGGVTGVIATQFGPAILRVKGITPSTVKPYAEVADEIKREISASRAGDKIQALHDKIEDARVSGKSLAEAAKAAGLTVETVAGVDAQGKSKSGAPVNLPDKADLLRAIFASDVGLDEAPLQTNDNGYVWFAVTKVDPAHDRTFEEAKSDVEKDWRAQEVDKALSAKAEALLKRIEAGASLAEVAKSAGAETKTAVDIHRDDTSLPPAVVAAIFRVPADGSGSAATPDGRTVFKITADRTPAVDFADLRVKAMAEKLDTAARNGLLEEYVAALRRSLGVTVNESVLQRAEGG